jgi:phytoene dehydrogenase-like protein
VSMAIARAAQEAGATLVTNVEAKQFLVEEQFENIERAVTGVVLADGTVVRAKQVLSNATPAVTFLVINSLLPSHVILVASIHSDVSTLLVSSTEGVLMR